MRGNTTCDFALRKNGIRSSCRRKGRRRFGFAARSAIRGIGVCSGRAHSLYPFRRRVCRIAGLVASSGRLASLWRGGGVRLGGRTDGPPNNASALEGGKSGDAARSAAAWPRKDASAGSNRAQGAANSGDCAGGGGFDCLERSRINRHRHRHSAFLRSVPVGARHGPGRGAAARASMSRVDSTHPIISTLTAADCRNILCSR